MQTTNILSASLIDLIFDGRNKEYGAYELRTAYHKRINKALLITAVIAALAFGGAALASSLKKEKDIFKMRDGIVLTEVPVEKAPEKLPDPIKKAEPVQVKTEIYTAPKIVDKDVLQTPPPSIDDLADAKIDLFKKEGVVFDGTVTPETIGEGK